MADEEKKVEETTEAAPEKEAVTEAPTEEKTEETTPEAAPAEEKTKEADAVSEVLAEAEEEEVVEEVQKGEYDHIRPGMIVRIHERIKDVSPKGEPRERVQIFQGLVIGVRGGGVSKTVTVRKDSKGFMVEKIYPLASPNLDKIEVVKQYRVRRAKLNYLRGRFRRKLREIKQD